MSQASCKAPTDVLMEEKGEEEGGGGDDDDDDDDDDDEGEEGIYIPDSKKEGYQGGKYGKAEYV